MSIISHTGHCIRLCTLLLCQSLLLSAQPLSYFPESLPGDKKGFAVADIGYQLTSSAIASSFVQTLLRGGYIDSTLKEQTASKLKGNNRAGGYLSTGLLVGTRDSLFGKSGWGAFADFRFRLAGHAGFSEDLFRTVFFGNKSYAGETAHLAPLNMAYFHFKQFRLGLTKSTGKHSMGIALSLISGQQHFSVDAGTAELYTHPDGEVIDLDLAMTYRESDTTSPGFFSVMGVGSTLDLFWEKTTDQGRTFRMEIGDIGGIRWVGGQAGTYDIDTVYRWEGWEVDDLFSLRDSIFDGAGEADSLKNALTPNKKKENYVSVLPASVHFSYGMTLQDGRLACRGGIHYLLQANYFPYVYVRTRYNLDEYFAGGLQLAYGGYGGLQVGVNIGLQLGKNMDVLLGSYHVAGLLLPKNARGQGLYFGLRNTF